MAIILSTAQQVTSKKIFRLDNLIPPAGTEFICVINKQGRIEQSILKEGINMTKEKTEMFAMALRLQGSMQSDFDYEFGTVHYTIIERENARFVSMPAHAGIILAKLNKLTDPFVFIDKIIGIHMESREYL